MAIVKFKRNWFGPDGKTYVGLAEVPNQFIDPERQIPSDAIVMSDDGSLPSDGVPIKPGFGAKPEHEQVLDQIPGAAPTHMIGTRSTDDMHPPMAPGPLSTASNVLDAAQEAHNTAIDKNADRVAETRAAVAKGTAEAKEMAVAQATATGDKQKIAAAEAIVPASGTTSDDAKTNEDYTAANALAEKNARIEAAESTKILKPAVTKATPVAPVAKIEPATTADTKKL